MYNVKKWNYERIKQIILKGKTIKIMSNSDLIQEKNDSKDAITLDLED